ncbi:hypothetical protein [Aeromicrobium massiliense]|uniref:hypothetical protein n=1 Tax=Aeromicrobium massiliense TaxID=1464554 RepID=UPI0005781D23|nr:hypothetical protein [Aeromicrobium massiliense]
MRATFLGLRGWTRRHAALLLGVVAVLPLVVVDPAAIAVLLNAEMLVAMGTVGTAMLRGDLRHLWRRVADSTDVAMIRGGIALTRQHPRSILTWVGP